MSCLYLLKLTFGEENFSQTRGYEIPKFSWSVDPIQPWWVPLKKFFVPTALNLPNLEKKEKKTGFFSYLYPSGITLAACKMIETSKPGVYEVFNSVDQFCFNGLNYNTYFLRHIHKKLQKREIKSSSTKMVSCFF